MHAEAVRDVFAGESTSAENVVADLELVARLNSIVLCSRHRVGSVFVNNKSGIDSMAIRAARCWQR